jgi:exo-1,4-beta-D-glucosaminidase
MFKRMNTHRGVYKAVFGVAIAVVPTVHSGHFMAAQTSGKTSDKTMALGQWKLASSCTAKEPGSAVSTPSYRAGGWLPVTVPSTVLAAQLAAGRFDRLATPDDGGKPFDPYFGTNLRLIPGTSYPVGTFFSNQEVPADSPYACGWWYRTEFKVEREQHRGERTWLRFAGINYSGEIWVNGQKIAGRERIAGAYRRYELDVTKYVRPGGENVVAVETFAPGAKNLGINWVDWNPCPADKNMGLWGAVTLVRSGSVTVRSPMVTTHFVDDSLSAADLTVRALVANATDEPVHGTLQGSISGLSAGSGKTVKISLPVELAAHETREVELAPKDIAGLHVDRPEVWWPYGLGGQHLNTLSLSFLANGGVSDTATARFGIRETSGELDAAGHRLFKINRHPILIRGGGWSPDMLLRESPERMREQFKLVRDLHLNTIRLEGKLETEQFFDLADEQGVLVMAGWCCCDHWEHWKDWTDDDLTIATDSLRGQMLRLRSHASLLVWLNGSDGPPPDRVENAYLAVEKETHWPNALLSSASATPTVPTGQSGVKMLGPYDYVVPSYWLRDTQKAGGAYGFNTETSPGPAVPDISELKRFLPPDKLWPINTTWDYHTGGGKYKSLAVINRAMDNIYGPATDLPAYTRTAEAMEYDAERAMFEAYGRNKYHATGVVQWMLNNAWPSLIWHLYDYYLQPGAGYYGAKKANEPLHIQYSYDDGSVVVVNSTFAPVERLRVEAAVLDASGKTLFKEEKPVDVTADSATRTIMIPADARGAGLTFVRLTLKDSAGAVVSTNTYWLSNKQTEFDWAKTDYTHTPPSSFEDLTALKTMPEAKIAARMLPVKTGEAVRIELRNPSQAVAFQVALASFKADGKPYDTLLWNDNFIELLPGETRTLTATALRPETIGTLRRVEVTGWNFATIATETLMTGR